MIEYRIERFLPNGPACELPAKEGEDPVAIPVPIREAGVIDLPDPVGRAGYRNGRFCASVVGVSRAAIMASAAKS